MMVQHKRGTSGFLCAFSISLSCKQPISMGRSPCIMALEKKKQPTMIKIIVKYSSCLPSNVYSARIFSAAGNVIIQWWAGLAVCWKIMIDTELQMWIVLTIRCCRYKLLYKIWHTDDVSMTAHDKGLQYRKIDFWTCIPWYLCSA